MFIMLVQTLEIRYHDIVFYAVQAYCHKFPLQSLMLIVPSTSDRQIFGVGSEGTQVGEINLM
jgi:hypothetical protein